MSPMLSSIKITPALARALKAADDEGTGNVIEIAPNTFHSLRERGIVGPEIASFACKQQAPHGTWFNRQFIRCALMHGPTQRKTN